MASSEKNLSVVEGSDIPDGSTMRIAIVVSEWNEAITGALFDGAVKTLLENKVKKDNIIISKVPGSFELTLATQFLCEDKSIEAVIALGCVIQGETKHFDFICDAVAHGITNVGLKYNKPVIFGVLTTNTERQAEQRSGPTGNKGAEAAQTAIEMAALLARLKKP